nr:hypothetical protein [Tanacetum cinerariifolium]
MATFVYGYISDLSHVKDNIKLRVRILRAWLQPLYNNQQVKNIEMIAMDEHGVQSIIVGTVIAIQEDEGWWFCLQIRVQDETGTMSLSLFNDEVQAMSESDGSIPTEIINLIGNKYAFKVAIDDYNVKKLLPVFIVLRFFNDQEIINYVVARVTPIKDNEATSNTVPAITSLVKSQTDENTTPNEKQKTNKRPAEGELGSESSTEKKKAVEIKILSWMKTIQPMQDNVEKNCCPTKKCIFKGSKCLFEYFSYRRTPKQSTNLATSPLAIGNSKTPTLENSNVLQTPAFCNTITTPISSWMMPNSPTSVATRGQQVTPVASTRKQQSSLNDVSKVSQSSVLCNTINHDNSSTLGCNSSPTSCSQVTPVDQACKRRSPLSDVSNEQSHDEVQGCLKGGSRNSGGNRLANSMVEEAWLNEKEDV